MVTLSALKIFFLSDKIVNYTDFHIARKKEQYCCRGRPEKSSYGGYVGRLSGPFVFRNDTSYAGLVKWLIHPMVTSRE